MRVLIDGHNAIGALGIGGESDEKRRRTLLRRLAAARVRATVFFDARQAPPGAVTTGRELGVAVRYCRAREADAAILEAVRDSAAPGRLVVVTNDREVAGRAAQLGAKTQRVADFFGAPEKEPPSRRRPRPPRRLPPFKPSDFGLPDEIDLSDPDLDD